MAEPADRALLDGLAALGAALEEIGAPAMVIGGIAVIARGVPRQTVDVDATVWAAAVDLDTLARGLARHGIVPRTADALEFARRQQVLLLRHEPSGTPMEVSLAWLPFERDALDRATLVDFGGVRIRVAAPEDLVVYKAVAWRERDRADIERLLARHASRIDLGRVRSLVREFAHALDEPERVAAFDAIVTRLTGRGVEDRDRPDPGR
jgi:hypothetical protein